MQSPSQDPSSDSLSPDGEQRIAQSSERVLRYHERTKHHFDRSARSLGYLDWAAQPEPFRTYAGASRLELPFAADGLTTLYRDLFAEGGVRSETLGLKSIGAFFELALGITAWKEHGASRWALRSNPSSGNLHPTETYAVLPAASGLSAGIHHYLSRDHCLEQRCGFDATSALWLERMLPGGGFLVGISSIHWREAWKYGERAFRYCQHDAGHVIGTVRFAAAALGWTARLLDACGDALVAKLLGLDRDRDFASIEKEDREHPDALLLIAPAPWDDRDARAEELERSLGELAELLGQGSWTGTPNALSSAHVRWDVIDDVAEAGRKPHSRTDFHTAPSDLPPITATSGASTSGAVAPTIIRGRRSAVAFDGRTSITSAALYAMLDKLLPRRDCAPWDSLPWEPKLHLALFVHRVEGLAPGLYLFERRAGVHEPFVSELGREALWSRPPDCPAHLRFYCIGTGDFQRTAATVSCHQEIAAAGAFSLGMIAEFRAAVSAGAYCYRRLFWESGVIGQVLYLEAEALGIRGTGIGCYFDDAFHEVLGLESGRFQSLYHFTMGGPVEDSRLVTHTAYGHLERCKP